MHERYFYLAEALMAVYVVRRPRNAWAAVPLYLADFTRYASFLFADRNNLELASGFFTAEVQTLLVAAGLLWILRSFYKELQAAETEKAAVAIL